MESPFVGKEIWFLTGSQDLYGPETLDQVTAQSQEVAALLDGAESIPVSIVHRPTLKDRDAIRAEQTRLNMPVNGRGGQKLLGALRQAQR